VKRTDRTRKQGHQNDGDRHTDIPEEEGLFGYWKVISREETTGRKMKRKDCGKTQRLESFRPSARINRNVTRR
jgi:hypothetical protein